MRSEEKNRRRKEWRLVFLLHTLDITKLHAHKQISHHRKLMNFSTTLNFFSFFSLASTWNALFSAIFFHPIHFTDRSNKNKNVFCLLVCKSSFCLFIFYFRSKFVAKKRFTFLIWRIFSGSNLLYGFIFEG